MFPQYGICNVYLDSARLPGYGWLRPDESPPQSEYHKVTRCPGYLQGLFAALRSQQGFV